MLFILFFIFYFYFKFDNKWMVIFFWIYKMGVAVLTSKFDGIIYLFEAIHYKFSL